MTKVQLEVMNCDTVVQAKSQLTDLYYKANIEQTEKNSKQIDKCKTRFK